MNKKGFTLIELLAVIIIIAVIGLIAIPSISSTIEGSRKKAYISIANAYVDAVREKITSRKFVIKKDKVAYYIPIDLIEIEGGTKQSPYGDWAKAETDVRYIAYDKDDVGNCSNSGTVSLTSDIADPFVVYNTKYKMLDSSKTYTKVKNGCVDKESISEAYVIVAYNEARGKYEYFWASRDVTNHRVSPTKIENLTVDNIKNDTRPIVKFSAVDKYVVKESNANNPTSGTKITTEELNAMVVGAASKVSLFFPDKNIGLGSLSYSLTTEEALQCYDIEVKSDGTILIRKYKSTCPKDVIIPSSIDGRPVTELYQYSFASLNLTSVIIPDSVVTIGYRAFYNNKLTYVLLPNTNVSVGGNAFSINDLNWDSVNITANTSLGGGAFTDNNFDEDNAFIYKVDAEGNRDIRYLLGYAGTSKNIIIPEGVEEISAYAFRNLGIETLVLPSTIKSIGSRAFEGNALQSVNFPDGLETIGAISFKGNQLTTLSNIPSSVTSIGYRAFNNNLVNDGTEFVYARDGSGNPVTSTIVSYASNKTEVTIPGNVTTINKYAFYGCGLTKITIPSTVKTIGRAAFNNNSVPDANGPFIYARKLVSGSTYTEDTTNIIGYAGKNDDPVVPNTVVKLGSYAFEECGLKSIAFEPKADGTNAITTIGASAFTTNKITKPITIPSSVTSIGSSAFCKSLASAKYNYYTSIINKAGKGFNWKDITCSHIDTISDETGVIEHHLGNITVTK